MTAIEILNAHIANSIERALRGESYLDPDVLKISGFATPTMRHLFSNLCHIEGISYLECGTFAGSSLVSAFNNNPIHAIGIDNFTQEFSQAGVKEELEKNLDRWRGTAKSVRFINADCFEIGADLELPAPVDVFFYDAEHSEANQARALPTFFRMMAKRFIFIVDDYNWESVWKGTKAGFERLELRIENEWVLTGDTRRSDDPTWHNGVGIWLISKIDGAAT